MVEISQVLEAMEVNNDSGQFGFAQRSTESPQHSIWTMHAVCCDKQVKNTQCISYQHVAIYSELFVSCVVTFLFVSLFYPESA